MKKFKKLISLMLIIAMTITCLPVVSIAAEESSVEHLTEVPEGYIGIYTVEDLYCVRNDLTANYIMMNDIDLSEATAEGGDWNYGGRGWNPIGSNDDYSKGDGFSGIFDGNNYTIKDMKINITSFPTGTAKTHYIGLFSYVTGNVRNLNVDGSITINRNVYNRTFYIGGLAAVSDGIIESVNVNVSINGSFMGTLSYYDGTDDFYIGGVVGRNAGDIKYCRNNGLIYGEFGENNERFYVHLSGIAGYGEGNISGCINSGEITVDRLENGYVGWCQASGIAYKGKITDCYNTANVSSPSSSRCYSAGISYDGTCTNCYNLGIVTGYDAKYGISSKTATKCYYLSGTGESSTGATELTEAQMKLKSMYSGWDFDTVWTMEGREDYPYPELRDVPLVFPEDYKEEIKGEISIVGDTTVGSTLTVDTSKLENENSDITIEWVIGGEVVGTGDSYTLTEDDAGKEITVNIKGDGDFKGTISSTIIVDCAEHSFTSYVSNNDATCTADGTKTAKCDNCNATDTIADEGSKKGHSYTSEVTKEATHLEEGETTYTCECGDSYTEAIAKLEGHSYTSEVTKEATHLEEGETTYTCECGDSYTEAIAKLEGHSYTSEVTKEATHLEEGETTYTCECGDSYTEAIAKLEGHSYTSEVTKEATHLEEGETTYTCECGDSYTEAIAKLEGHSYTSEVTKEATHLEEGETTYTCECGDSYTEAIAKLEGHTYKSVVTAPTCTSKGYTTYTCECGDTYIADYVDEAEHSFTNYISNNDATCTADGTKTAKCNNCDAKETVVDKGSAKGHSYNLTLTPATCDKEGSKVYTCECGNRYSEVIPALGHKDDNRDGYCDDCREDIDGFVDENECLCICHEEGAGSILYKILLFIQRYFKVNLLKKVFKMNRICECGVNHY